MDPNDLPLHCMRLIKVWHPGRRAWKKYVAVYLGLEKSTMRFLVHETDTKEEVSPDDTLFEYAMSQPRWVVYAEAPRHVADRVGYLELHGSLVAHKYTYLMESEEGLALTAIARQAGLIS